MVLIFVLLCFFAKVDAQNNIEDGTIALFGDKSFDTKCPILILCVVTLGLTQFILKTIKYYTNIDFSEKPVLFFLTVVGALIFPAEPEATLEQAMQVNILYFAYAFNAMQILFLIQPASSCGLVAATFVMTCVSLITAVVHAYLVLIPLKLVVKVPEIIVLTLNFYSTAPTTTIPILNQTDRYKIVVNLILFEYAITTTLSVSSLECLHLYYKLDKSIIAILSYKFTCSIFFGFLIGQLLSLILMYCKLNAKDVVLVIYGSVFITLLSANWLYLPGHVSLMVLCYYIYKDLNKLTPITYEVLKTFTNTVFTIVENTIYVYCIYCFLIIGNFYDFKYVFHDFFNYSLLCLMRLFLTCCFTWLFKRLVHSSFQLYHSVIIGLMCPVSTFTLAFPINYLLKMPKSIRILLIHLALFVSLMSSIVNNASLSVLIKLNMKRISYEKINKMVANLNSVLDKRNVYILMLKYHNDLGDVNWTIVKKNTLLKLPAPYPKNVRTLREAVGSTIPDERNDNCSEEDCPMVTREHLRPEEYERSSQLLLQEQLRLLLMRKYDYGMISPEVLNILLKLINNAVKYGDDEDILIEVLEKVLKQNNVVQCLDYVRVKFFFNKEADINKPRVVWRRIFYRIRKHKLFQVTIYMSNLVLVIGLLIFNLETVIKVYTLPYYICVFIFEFFTHIFAYSRIYIWKDGVKTYFKSVWHCIDFVCLISLIINYGATLHSFILGIRYDYNTFGFYIKYAQYLRVIQLLDPLIPRLLNKISRSLESNILLGYEVAVVLSQCYDELLFMLDRIVSDEASRKVLLRRLTVERNSSQLMMLKVAYDYNWMSITVKTKITINACKQSMANALEHLKTSGFINTNEYILLNNCIYENQHKLRMLTKLPIMTQKAIFFTIPWIERSIENGEYLFSRAILQHFKPGTVICKEESYNDGIFVIISGVVSVSYTPDPKTLEQFTKYGAIPIVDYFETIDYGNVMKRYLSPGDTLGELSWLTNRPYNSNVTTVTDLIVFFLHDTFLRQAIGIEDNILNGTESYLWRFAVKNMVLTVLLNTPYYHDSDAVQLCIKLDRSFVPTLTGFNIFYVTEIMEDVILLDGVVSDFFDKEEEYTAPCYIPRSVTKLHLSKHSQQGTHIDPKILIIPYEHLTNDDIKNKTTIHSFAQVHDDGRIRSLRSKAIKKKNYHPVRKVAHGTHPDGLLESSLLLFQKYKDLEEASTSHRRSSIRRFSGHKYSKSFSQRSSAQASSTLMFSRKSSGSSSRKSSSRKSSSRKSSSRKSSSPSSNS